MQTNTDKDFQDVRDKVNQIDQRVNENVLPALNDIQITLSKMSFLPKEDYIKDEIKKNKKFEKFEAFMIRAERAISFFEKLDSRWTQILIGALIAGALFAVVSQIPNLGVGK